MGMAAAVYIVRVRIVRVRPLAAQEPRTGLRLKRANANYGLASTREAYLRPLAAS